MKCRKCNKGANDIGGYLARVNEKGVKGIWECRPSCDASMPPDDRLIAAIEGEASLPASDSPAREVWVSISVINGCAMTVEDELPENHKDWATVKWVRFVEQNASIEL